MLLFLINSSILVNPVYDHLVAIYWSMAFDYIRWPKAKTIKKTFWSMLSVQCLKVKSAYMWTIADRTKNCKKYDFNFISYGCDPVKFIRLMEKLNKQPKKKKKKPELMNKTATQNGALHLHAIHNNSITLRAQKHCKTAPS